MSEKKELRHYTCGCGVTVAFCQKCNLRTVEVETTDHLSLCMTCAQDSHLPCPQCGDVVPSAEIDEQACLACRVLDAERYDGDNQRRRRGLFEAERILLLVLQHGPESGWLGSLNPELALRGVRIAHHSG